MDPIQAKERIDQLTELLNSYNHAYYVQDTSLVSDFEFDQLLEELQGLEQAFPDFVHIDSPSKRVGGEINKNFLQVEHRYPMLSLGNTYSQEELFDFDERIRKLTNEAYDYVCELKYDGVAIGLHYVDGVLVQAVTRGDGVKGDDVTANVRTIKSIPLKLSGDYPADFEIRGEILLPHKEFEKLNQIKLDDGDDPFANPRNAASGSLKMQNSKDVAKRHLDCYLYFLMGENLPKSTHEERLKKVASWGFKVGDYYKRCASLQDVFSYIDYWNEARKKLPFDIDGIVVKVNQVDLWERLGYTAKSPRWAIAYKFKAERAATELLSISFQVGRTGAITPVANLKPVLLGGTVVKRASLYNSDMIEKMDIRPGDTVYVEKGGEIIPKITAVEESHRDLFSTPFTYISHCPECGSKLVREEGETMFYCPNEEGCPPQIKGKLTHFISRKAMDINSLGEGKIDLLFDQGLIRNQADLYDLTYDQLFGLEKNILSDDGTSRKIGFKEKTVNNILKGISDSKSIPFERVLYAIGILFVGETVAKTLAKHYKNMTSLMQATEAELTEINEIGSKIAASVVFYFQQPKHIEMITRLREHGLQLELDQNQHQQLSNKLAGQSFVVSGVFSKPRNEIKALIEDHGGKNVGSISSKTSYVLAGEKMGGEKKKKAESLGIPVISEEDFFQLLRQ